MKIVTLAFNRPDFIEIQLKTLKRHIKNFEYIVFDSSDDDKIEKECDRFGVKRIKILNKGNFPKDPSWTVSCCLEEMWKTMQTYKGIVVYIDADMFLLKELPLMVGHDMAFVPMQIEGEKFYPWTGLMFFNMDILPNKHEIMWSMVSINGIRCDPGGYNYVYFLNNQPRYLELEMWTLLDEDKRSFNGKDIEWNHENFDKIATKVSHFPRPYSVDFFKVKGESFEDSFVFHYKSASNYSPHATVEYNELKTKALLKLLCY